MIINILPILILIACSSVSFAMSAKHVACNKSYRVLIHDFQSSVGESILKKITKEIGQLVEVETGCKFNYENSSVIRGFLDMQSHRADIFASMSQEKGWDRHAILVPVWSVKRVMLVRDSKNLPKSVEKIIEDPNYRIGVQTGIDFLFREEELKKLREQKQMMEGATLNSLVNLFKAGKIQGFFVPPTVFEQVEKLLGKSFKVKLMADPRIDLDVGLYISKTRLSEEEQKRIIEAVESVRKKGAIKHVFETNLRPDLLQYYSL